MDSGCSLIRLIDVALIILLGFIATSSLKLEHIDLPTDEKSAQSEGASELFDLRIHKELYELKGASIRQRFKELEELEDFLVALKESHNKGNKAIALNIEAESDLPIQSLVDVIDLCQNHNITKNLSYVTF